MDSIPARIASSASPGQADAVEAGAMRRAIRLARRGIGTTHPNPRVGAVILRGGRVVGEGFHARAGEAHAEIRALLAAGESARGATLVVTLEPCAHVGRTPPCTDAVLAAGIRRVVIGMRDPNPLVDGRGIQELLRGSVDVVVGVLEEECRELNPAYLKHLATGLPWATLKAMLSLDGRLAAESGESRGLGSEAEQRAAHRLRAESDAVLAGIGTVLLDDPLLTVRGVRGARGRNPARVVLDSSLRIPAGARIWGTVAEAPLVLATVSTDEAKIRALEERGAQVWAFPKGADGRVPLRSVLERLALEGRLSVLVEGGALVHTAFLREGLADAVAIGIAPRILGGRSAPMLTGDLGRSRLADAIAVEGLTVRRLGPDVWLTGRIAADGGDRV